MANVSKPYVTMMKGLITETSPLTPVEGSYWEGENFIIDLKNNIRRREGLEATDTLISYQGTIETYTQAYRWKNSYLDQDVIVLGIFFPTETKVYLFREVNAENLDYALDETINMNAYQIGSSIGTDITFASAGNELIVVGNNHYPVVVKRISLYSYEERVIVPYERDLEGREDGLPLDERNSNYITNKDYNLFNQGWPVDEIVQFRNEQGNKNPSNCDIVHLGRYVDSNGDEQWGSSYITSNFFGNTPAPKGHIVRNVFMDEDFGRSYSVNYIDYSWQDGSPGNIWYHYHTEQPHDLAEGDFVTITTSGGSHTFEVESGHVEAPTTREIKIQTGNTYAPIGEIGLAIRKQSGGRDFYITQDWNGMRRTDPKFTNDLYHVSDDGFTSVEIYSSRLWFAGLPGKKSNRIYFSQTLLSPDNKNKFFSHNDPTSEFSDILNSDGGYVVIPEIGNIVNLYAANEALYVFASNGVWKLMGTVDGVFSAASYNLEKIAEVGCASNQGSCELNGTVFFAGCTGVYAIQPNNETTNLTQSTIRDKYAEIGATNRRDVILTSDGLTNTVHMLYTTNPYSRGYDKELILDLVANGWHQYTYAATPENSIVGMFSTRVCNDERKNIAYITSRQLSDPEFLWYSVSTLTNSDYRDFVDSWYAGNYFVSKLKTAMDNLGELSKRKSSTYLRLFKWNHPDNQFTFKVVWDWMIEGTTKKEVELSALNKYDERYDSTKTGVAIVKDSVRGHGDSLYISLTSINGKHCNIFGWTVDFSGSGAT